MRQLNFLLFFALCLALALFSIENTQTAAINIIPNVQVEAPLSIELLLAVGTGAMLAWMFSLWDQLQRQIESWKAQRELKQQSKKIEELEKTLSELQEEREKQDSLLSVTTNHDDVANTSENMALEKTELSVESTPETEVIDLPSDAVETNKTSA